MRHAKHLLYAGAKKLLKIRICSNSWHISFRSEVVDIYFSFKIYSESIFYYMFPYGWHYSFRKIYTIVHLVSLENQIPITYTSYLPIQIVSYWSTSLAHAMPTWTKNKSHLFISCEESLHLTIFCSSVYLVDWYLKYVVKQQEMKHEPSTQRCFVSIMKNAYPTIQ